MKLEGLTAVITGSTGRLGAAIAIELAGAGMDCFCHYHTNGRAAAALAERIIQMGRRAQVFQADLRDERGLEELMDKAFAFGQVRGIINSAAVFEKGPISEVTAESVNRLLSLNLVAPLMLAKAFAARLGKTKTGPSAKIVNIADVGGIRPWKGYSAYCASKAALIAATKSLAKELAPDIAVSAVAPGAINWPMGGQEEKERLLRHIPAGRFGTAEEVARAVLFALENDYITGQTIVVDGGRSI